MESLQLFAHPWWVNLLMLVPFAAYGWWRTTGLRLSWRVVGVLTTWSAAFGVIEGAVVVYLRALLGSPLGYDPTFVDMARLSVSLEGQPLIALPPDILVVEMWREGATIIMLLSVAVLAATGWRERTACFLWAFAVWDIVYYLTLRVITGWPLALTTPDVLFLIPEPWLSQLWFPLMVSSGTLLAIALALRRRV